MFDWEFINNVAAEHSECGVVLFDDDALCEFSALTIDLSFSGWHPIGVGPNGFGGITLGTINDSGCRLTIATNHRGLCSAYAVTSPEWPRKSRRYASGSLLRRIIRSKYWSFE